MPAVTESKLTTVCLADYVDDSARDLDAIATPGQATLLAELCETGKSESVVHQVTHRPIQQYTKQGKMVHLFSPNTPGWTADAVFQAGADNACIKHTMLTKGWLAIDLVEEAMKFEVKPELIVFWLPQYLNQDEYREFFQAASDLAETGAAVLFVLRLIPKDQPHSGMPTIFQTAGASVDNYFHRVWIVQDKTSAINTTRCNLLCPLADPKAEAGYTFAVEGQRPVFNLQHRAKNAKQSTSMALPHVELAVPNIQ